MNSIDGMPVYELRSVVRECLNQVVFHMVAGNYPRPTGFLTHPLMDRWYSKVITAIVVEPVDHDEEASEEHTIAQYIVRNIPSIECCAAELDVPDWCRDVAAAAVHESMRAATLSLMMSQAAVADERWQAETEPKDTTPTEGWRNHALDPRDSDGETPIQKLQQTITRTSRPPEPEPEPEPEPKAAPKAAPVAVGAAMASALADEALMKRFTVRRG